MFQYKDKGKFVGDENIDFFRACATLDRAAHLGIYENPPKTCDTITNCFYCGETIDEHLFYINTPKVEYFLCQDCGNLLKIGEKKDGNLIYKSELKINCIVLKKYELLYYRTDNVAETVYCNKKPRILYNDIVGYEAAVSLNDEYHTISGVILDYKDNIKNCCDLMYNITKEKIIYPTDGENYTEDKVLCLFLRDKYPFLTYYIESYKERRN